MIKLLKVLTVGFFLVGGVLLARTNYYDDPSTAPASGTTYDDDIAVTFGTGSDATILWETADASAHFLNINLGTSRNVIISEDASTDWGHAASTNPALFIQSSDAATTADYLSLSHNQTDAIIASGAGEINVQPVSGSGVTLTQAVGTSGTPAEALTVVGAAHTGLDNVALKDVYFDLSRTVTMTGGGGAISAYGLFTDGITYAADAGQILGGVFGAYFDAGPTAGANITFAGGIANVFAASYDVTGALTPTAAANIVSEMPSIANGQGTLGKIFAIAVPNLGSDILLGNQIATVTSVASLGLDSLTFTSDTLTRTVTNMANLYIDNAHDVSDTEVDVTNGPYAIFVDDGTSRFDGRVYTRSLLATQLIETQGSDIASASTIALVDDGNVFELTGTTSVDLITSTGWQDGVEVMLIANENVTVNHATATSGSNITVLLAGAGNFAMTANDVLKLVLSSTTADGQAWREVSRSVN